MDEGKEAVLEADEEKPEKKVKVKLIPVTVIAGKGASALVEWQDGDRSRRAFVPEEKVKDGQCDEIVLKAGVSYGVPWEEILDISGFSPDSIAQELRRLGLWTSADLEKNPKAAQKAILAASGLSLGVLHGIARQYEEEGK